MVDIMEFDVKDWAQLKAWIKLNEAFWALEYLFAHVNLPPNSAGPLTQIVPLASDGHKLHVPISFVSEASRAPGNDTMANKEVASPIGWLDSQTVSAKPWYAYR